MPKEEGKGLLRKPGTKITPGKKQPQRDKSTEKYNSICEAAEALLDRYNVPDISMVMIAKESGVVRTTIYDFFQSPADIFRKIAKHYLWHSWYNIIGCVSEHQPESLLDLIHIHIDCSVAYFNSHNAARKTLMGTDYLEIHLLIDDFESMAAKMFHAVCRNSWHFQPYSEDDPFGIMATMQLALYTTSVRKYDLITPKYVDHIKLVSEAYLDRFFGNTAHQPILFVPYSDPSDATPRTGDKPDAVGGQRKSPSHTH